MKQHYNLFDRQRLPLRIYYAREAVGVMMASIFLSSFLVSLYYYFTPANHYSKMDMLLATFAIFGLTMVIGGHWMLKKAQEISRPIEEVTEAVQTITAGDFTVRVAEGDKKFQILEIKNLKKDINQMAAALQGIEYMSKDFMANISHEFNTPLAAISGYAEMLLDDELTAQERKDYLHFIQEQASHLAMTCQNILLMVKLDGLEIVSRQEEVRLDESIRKALIVVEEKWLQDRDIELDLEEASIISNPHLLSQVWTNLLDNAFKYSPQDSPITIQARVYEGQFIVHIINQGPPIPEDKLEKIFDKFYQVNESRQVAGNGLGLSIVRRILELLKGSIYCTSNERETRFTLELELTASNQPDMSQR